jgi:hypothetical protein
MVFKPSPEQQTVLVLDHKICAPVLASSFVAHGFCPEFGFLEWSDK